MPRDTYGNPLVAGVNLDHINIEAGARRAAELGYDDATAQMVVGLVLNLWRRGEEANAQSTWLHNYPRDLTSFYVIVASAQAAADPETLALETLGDLERMHHATT